MLSADEHRIGEMRQRPEETKSTEGEDSLEAALPRLIAEGRLGEAGRRAIADQLARGFPVTFQRGELVIKLFPDGREEVLARVPVRPYKLPIDISVVETK